MYLSLVHYDVCRECRDRHEKPDFLAPRSYSDVKKVGNRTDCFVNVNVTSHHPCLEFLQRCSTDCVACDY